MQTNSLLCWCWGRVNICQTGGDGSIVLSREGSSRRAPGGVSECGNRISDANFPIMFHSNYGSILFSFGDMTTGQTKDGWQTMDKPTPARIHLFTSTQWIMTIAKGNRYCIGQLVKYTWIMKLAPSGDPGYSTHTKALSHHVWFLRSQCYEHLYSPKSRDNIVLWKSGTQKQ